MARTMKTTGFMANCTFCLGVDTGAAYLYKAVDSSGNDSGHTVACRDTMDPDDGVGYGSRSFNGHTLEYFLPDSASPDLCVRFVTNLPNTYGNKTTVLICTALGANEDGHFFATLRSPGSYEQ